MLAVVLYYNIWNGEGGEVTRLILMAIMATIVPSGRRSTKGASNCQDGSEDLIGCVKMYTIV